MMLSLILIAIIYMRMSQNIVTKYNEITIITIATILRNVQLLWKAGKSKKKVIRHF